MKGIKLVTSMLLFAVVFTACKKDKDTTPTPTPTDPYTNIYGLFKIDYYLISPAQMVTYKANIRITKDTLYRLSLSDTSVILDKKAITIGEYSKQFTDANGTLTIGSNIAILSKDNYTGTDSILRLFMLDAGTMSNYDRQYPNSYEYLIGGYNTSQDKNPNIRYHLKSYYAQ